MNDTAAKIAFNLANHPRYQWGDGALALRWAPGYADHLKVGYRVDRNMVESGFTQGLVPDLNDPATIGTIEAQARALRPDLRFNVEELEEGIRIFARCQREDLAGEWEFHGKLVAGGFRGLPRGECWALAFLEVAEDGR